MPDTPVDLTDIALTWRPDPPTPQLDGRGPESAGVRPLMASGERYDRYSRALRDLARPRLFDNRVSYRLMDLAWAGPQGILGFHYTSYFSVLDMCEASAHEFTQAWLAAGQSARVWRSCRFAGASPTHSIYPLGRSCPASLR
jgi:hypothetical protein